MNKFRFAPEDPLERWQRLSRPRDEKIDMINAARRTATEIYPDLSLVYKRDRTGDFSHWAYALITPVLDDKDCCARRQPKVRRWTEWHDYFPFDPARRLDSFYDLHLELYGYAIHGGPSGRAWYQNGDRLPDYMWFKKNAQEK